VLRLDEIIRGSGKYTRKDVIALVNAGRVTVNGRQAEAISQRCDPAWDIRVDGEQVRMEPPVCLMMNKPAGYLTATVSGKEPPLTELLEERYRHLFPVGRLDLDSEGLILLTNDGGLCHRIIMPAEHITKEYYIEVTGQFHPDTVQRFREGMEVDNGLHCLPAEIEIAPDGKSAKVWIAEGKRHQVKRMAAAAGARVRYLKRLAIGGLRLDEQLEPGAYRPLTDAEIALIFEKTE